MKSNEKIDTYLSIIARLLCFEKSSWTFTFPSIKYKYPFPYITEN